MPTLLLTTIGLLFTGELLDRIAVSFPDIRGLWYNYTVSSELESHEDDRRIDYHYTRYP